MIDVRGGKYYSKANYEKDADLTTQVDGIVKIFTTPYAYISEHLTVFKNGINQAGDFVELSDTQFEMNNLPLAGDTIVVDFLKK